MADPLPKMEATMTLMEALVASLGVLVFGLLSVAWVYVLV
jgi:hypothetical protein